VILYPEPGVITNGWKWQEPSLYYVKNEKGRLGLVGGYTVAFALWVGLLTNARRSKVFGACAAYAAVLVVFISGNLRVGGSVACTATTTPTGVG
jgi:hypothetical protein